MRIIALFCLMMVSLLNFVPCADEQPVPSGTEMTVRLAAQNHENTLSADHCSPFCNCTCCATSSIAKIMSLTSTPVKEHQTNTRPYQAGEYIDISMPVWQPPQIA